MHVMNTALELIVGGFSLLLATKLLGKTQISQITPFDFISALVLGELVGNAVYQDGIGIADILFSVFIWSSFIFAIEVATQKSERLRTLFEGRPALVIQKGRLDWRELKRNHLDVDQLLQLLRTKDVFSLQEVEYAVLENNGMISVLKKSPNTSPTRRDFQLQNEEIYFPLVIISDGQIRRDVLQENGLNEEWLQEQLALQGVQNVKEVCFAEWQKNKTLYIQKFNKR